MPISLRPCPQCRRTMDANLSLCLDCRRANSLSQTVMDPPPDRTVGMSGPAVPRGQPMQGPASFFNGIGSGAGFGMGCCILFPILALLFFGFGIRGCSEAAQTPRGTALPAPPARMGTERPGPSLAQADASLNDPNATQAQRELRWREIKGTVVTWGGDIRDVELNPPKLRLRCNPGNSGADTYVSLEETEISKLGSLNKGQTVTVNAILQEHDGFGYTLAAGRIVGR